MYTAIHLGLGYRCSSLSKDPRPWPPPPYSSSQLRDLISPACLYTKLTYKDTADSQSTARVQLSWFMCQLDFFHT